MPGCVCVVPFPYFVFQHQINFLYIFFAKIFFNNIRGTLMERKSFTNPLKDQQNVDLFKKKYINIFFQENFQGPNDVDF